MTLSEQLFIWSVIPGTPCRDEGLGLTGVCRLMQHCPWWELFNSAPGRRYPQICSFRRNEPIVCCPHSTDSVLFPGDNFLQGTSTTTTPAPDFSRPKPVPTLATPSPVESEAEGERPGDIARRKCVEYESYALKSRYGPENDCTPNHKYPIGGNPASATEFAHMVLVGYGDEADVTYICGGSLISKQWVLTAAHCLVARATGDQVSWVLVGELVRSITTDNAYPQLIPVAERVPHPNFTLPEYYNDIALLRLAWTPNMTTGHARPCCLHVDRELEKEKLYLTGWGNTEYGGDPADALMEVAIYRTQYEECRKWYDGSAVNMQVPRGVDNDTQICAGAGQLKKDACQGDSGGPLQTPVIKPMCMYKVVGVVSLGQGCGFGAPGIYTRVSTYVPWIERLVWPDP